MRSIYVKNNEHKRPSIGFFSPMYVRFSHSVLHSVYIHDLSMNDLSCVFKIAVSDELVRGFGRSRGRGASGRGVLLA